MQASTFSLDASASRLLVHTRAQGLLARLAHDLELSSRALAGKATLEGDAWTAELELPVPSLAVEGVLHGETLDRTVLSPGDREQILAKMRDDVFASASRVSASAKGARRDRGEATITVGRSSMRAPLTLAVKDADQGALHVEGRFEVSIKALGGQPIKGPLGAFSVKDTVTIVLDLLLRPEAPTKA